jgi:aspartyl/asparaginyl-tRNA synthetase
LLGNYEICNGKIAYVGNKIQKQLEDVAGQNFNPRDTKTILSELTKDAHYKHLHNIDNAIFNASVDYFRKIGASWCNLPLTTKMISSPGEVYAGQKLDYTTDALPVELNWFKAGSIFLAESSQFYLEIRLIIEQLSQVYSIYNSFRKETVDFSHLAEFQHIEYEGKVDFERNIEIFIGLLDYITKYIIKHNRADLSHYLEDDEIRLLETTFGEASIERLTFVEAMDILADKLGDKKYNSYSLQHFGSYEEIALTRIIGKHCLVVEFPLEEIPFYHDQSFSDDKGRKYAKNADLILLGYREVVGSGQRITDIDAIKQKAEFFNLPMEDYESYINLRELPNYKTTCGFGLGWQRYTQWLLKMPFIWQMSHIPRSEHLPKP